MSGALAGRVALVTGGGWNIGRAIAERFAREGAAVAVAGRDAGRLEETARAIRATGARCIAAPADVTALDEVREFVERAREELGRPSVLAAIAGGGATYQGVLEIEPERWAEVVRVNLVGTFHAVRAALPFLLEGGGSIVTCAGGGAFFPLTERPGTDYASAKAGVCRLTDQLAFELLGTGVRVNCLQPGLVLAPRDLAAAREAERRAGAPSPLLAANHPPEDAAELATWLASDASAPLTGRIVSVDDAWWRDPATVARVAGDLHAFCLRRQGLPAGA